MKTYMAFPICSLLFILLVAVVYFSKPRIKSIENNIYKWLIVTNIIGLILEISCYFAVDFVNINPILAISILKLYVIYIFIWTVIFTCYVFMATYKNYNKDVESMNSFHIKLRKILIYVATILSIVMLFLPIEIYNDGKIAYTYGPITNVLIIMCFIMSSSWFYKCILNFKNIKQKRYIPIIACILELLIVLIIQSHDRSILIATTGHSFLVLLMYFTIENPDMKMISELNKNRILINQTTEDKSNFLFLASSQIKKPIKDIVSLADESINLTDKEQLINNFKQISNLSHDLFFSVNNVMDISSLSYSNIKVVNDKYNLINLLKKIKIVIENKIDDKIKFHFIADNNIPEYVYGDSKLLEQVIMSILENSLKYTKNGFIELRVNSIIKYDMARLVITVEDSGLGMKIDKVNELLLVDEDLTENDIKRLETNNVNMNTIKKLVSKLGGYFTIKSEVNKGTEVQVVIDQKIELEKQINANSYTGKNKVLIATSNKELKSKMVRIIQKYDYDIETSMYANDIFDRIRLDEEYAFIFLDDNLDKRAIEILNTLKKKKNFKTDIVVIIDKGLEMIKDQFKKDGFKDYILKENLENDLKRILESN